MAGRNVACTFCFYPRSREGATESVNARMSTMWVSIHAPVRERRDGFCNSSHAPGFYPRSREGATMFG